MARLFGTDGVRGLANRDITVEFSLRLAQAAALVLAADARSNGNRPKAVIGRDPRVSGEFIAAAIAAGFWLIVVCGTPRIPSIVHHIIQ